MSNIRLLVLNVYYAPFSFGGATIVAEGVIERLQQDFGCQVLVVTTIRDESILPYAIRRYRAKNVDVIGINLTRCCADFEDYDNRQVTDIVTQIVDHYQPHLVHVHSVQSMGCGYFDHILGNGVPIVVTVHDCWWICYRQFMIASDDRYCFQKRIDLRRCGYCVFEHERLISRDKYLREQLNKADLLLFPSEFHRELHIANGFDIEKCVVNKNGVRLPAPSYRKETSRDHRVVFGFVGGPGPIKGADLLIEAFRGIAPDRYELKVVDAAKNMGKSWEDKSYWDISGNVSFVPPYSQDTLDDFFSGLDILLFPSQWKESFGLTVREALVRNVWVIATSAGGVVEDLVDGENATVIPMDGDYTMLKKAIEGCLERSGWREFKNPYRAQIRSFGKQASELYKYFNTLLKRSRQHEAV